MKKDFGIHKARVVENFDPYGLGRIRIWYFQLGDVTTQDLPYAQYCSPMGGGNNFDGAGFFMVPEVGSHVWIMFEGGDLARPVWIGAPFFSEKGNQNPPIESKVATTEPLNRVIKTGYGNKIEFDDRTKDVTGNPTPGLRLESGRGRGLRFADAQGEVELYNSAAQPHRVKFTKNGAMLSSARGGGIFVNDSSEKGSTTISAPDDTSVISLQQHVVSILSGGLLNVRVSKINLDANGGATLQSGGLTRLEGEKIKLSSGSDTSISAGNNFNVLAPNNIRFTGGATSNVIFNLPAPGIPQVSGNWMANTVASNMSMRVGPQLPNPTSPLGVVASTAELNDPLQGAGKLARMVLGTTGTTVLEGPIGGVYISPVPVPHPGSAMGLGGRPLGGVPLAPITPAPTPGIGPQPAVLGGNLYQMMSTMFTAMQTLSSVMVASAPSLAISPVGPAAASPPVIAAWASFQAAMATLQTTHLTAPNPMGILSSVVHIDG